MNGIAKFTPGVHFGLPEDAYHATEALSASGIQHLRASPLDFWARSWMAPADDDEESAEDTFAKILGSAYHKRIVEGREAFARCYAPSITVKDCPKALVTVEDIR